MDIRQFITKGAERVNRFVNVHLHCVVRNLKRISKISMLLPPRKISADSHDCNLSLSKRKEKATVGNKTDCQKFSDMTNKITLRYVDLG